MQSSKIEELKRRRQAEIKPKKSQLPYLISLIILSLMICFYYFNLNRVYGLVWLVGILIGITMQRSRFCFVASFRDPILIGTTSLFRAIIIGLIISTIGFAAFQYKTIMNMADYSIQDIPGQIFPVGIHTIIGSILFGIGMIIAGACSSGVLIRIGEGHLLQILVLLGFVIGASLGVRNFEFWDRLFIQSSRPVYLPDHIGFFPALIVQLVVLLILYFLAGWYDKKNNFMNL